jgi:peptidylprolyl isomerase
MAQAKAGDVVQVHYTGTLDDGTVFDSSVDGDPLEFRIGAREIIPGLEREVIGMEAGSSKTVRIAADEAYGPHRREMVETVERRHLPPQIEPEVGMRLRAQQSDGSDLVLTITEVTSATVTLDANHPLAGRDLTFAIELVAVR